MSGLRTVHGLPILEQIQRADSFGFAIFTQIDIKLPLLFQLPVILVCPRVRWSVSC